MVVWVKRQASLTSRVWARPSAPCRPLARGGHHRHPGAVDGDVELVRSLAAVAGRREHGHLPARDRGRLGGEPLGHGGAVGLGGAFDPLGGQPDSGQFGEQVGGGGERLRGRGAGGHLAQARRQRRARDTEIVVAGRDPVFAFGAVVVGAAHGDPAQHGVDLLVAVTDELGEMLLPQSIRGPWCPVSVATSCCSNSAPSWIIAVRIASSTGATPAPQLSESAASAASRSTSAANAAAIWSRSPLFRPPPRPGAPWPPGSVGAPHRSPR